MLDLDPSTDDVAPVVGAARAIRDLLAEMDVTGFVGSTGSRGLHVHVDLTGPTDFEGSRALARELAEELVARAPDDLTVAQRRDDRGTRLFLDTLRNGYGQHAVAPFSLRARPGAPVAAPLTWAEATSSSFDPRGVTVTNVFRRLGAQASDPWRGRGRHRYRLDELRRRLERVRGDGRG